MFTPDYQRAQMGQLAYGGNDPYGAALQRAARQQTVTVPLNTPVPYDARRLEALRVAHDPAERASVVLERAEVYLRWLMGVPT